MKRFPRIPVLIGAVMLAFSVSPATAGGPPQELTSCNQDVEGDVYLTGDLDCTGVGGMGVNLLKQATLELRGFSIRNAQNIGVQCFKACTILGPGSITGSHNGIWAPRKVSVVDVDLLDNGVLGIGGDKIELVDSSVEGSRQGIVGGRRVDLVNSTVTGSDWAGVTVASRLPPSSGPCTHGRLSLRGSTVTGNATDSGAQDCIDRGCADVVTCRMPRLDDSSSCGTSLRDGPSEPWGVCTLD